MRSPPRPRRVSPRPRPPSTTWKTRRPINRAVITQAEAQRGSALARELETRQELERQDNLLRGGGAGTRQRLEQATAAHDTARPAPPAAGATIQAERAQRR